MALIGSFTMARNKITKIVPYVCWIICSILFIGLFSVTQQYGLILMNAVGILISIVGLYNWNNNEITENNKLTILLFFFAKLSVVVSLFFLLSFVLRLNIKDIEWFGALLSISANLLLASKHKMAKYCWVLWFVSNLVLFLLGLYNHQYGFAFLQFSFTILNIYGIFIWLIKEKIILK